MNDPYTTALTQIESADLTPKTRLAAKSLLQSVDPRTGHIKATRERAGEILGTTSWGATRRMLVKLKQAELIHYSTNEMVYVDFWAWLASGHQSDLSRAKSDLQRSLADDKRASEITFRAPEIEKRAPEIEKRAPEITSPEVEEGDGIGRYWVGRYTNNEDPNSDRYLPTAVPQAAGEIAELPPDQRWNFGLLTDPEIGMMPANALKCARLHKPIYVVKHVATWWGTRRGRGAGALFNRLLNWKQFPPHEEIDEDFLASALYRRHYPLDEEGMGRWERWRRYGNADSIQGLSPPDMPPEVEILVRQLPLPAERDGGAP